MRTLCVVLVSFLTATCGQKDQLDIPAEESSSTRTLALYRDFVDGKCSLLDSATENNGCSKQ